MTITLFDYDVAKYLRTSEEMALYLEAYIAEYLNSIALIIGMFIGNYQT